MAPLKSLSRNKSKTRKSKSKRYTDEKWNSLSPDKRLSVIDSYRNHEENFPQSSYFSLRNNNLNSHPNIPSRKKGILISKANPNHIRNKNSGDIGKKELAIIASIGLLSVLASILVVKDIYQYRKRKSKRKKSKRKKVFF